MRAILGGTYLPNGPARRILSITAATVVAGATVLVASGTANAYNNCGENGVYYCQAVTGAAGGVRLATTIGDDHHEYAQAWGGSNASNWAYYMDRSSDGGRTWEGWIDPVSNITEWSGDLYGTLYDGPPYVTRACITDYKTYVCTAWH